MVIARLRPLPNSGLRKQNHGEAMKRLIIKYWYVSIVVVVLMMLSLIALNTSTDQRNQPSKPEAKQAVIEIISFFDRTRMIGVSRKISPQWIKSDSLYAHASIDELIELASKHEDAIERLIAFRALLMKDPHEAANLTISEVDDTTLVGTSDGICGQEETVSDIRLYMMQYNREQSKVTINDSIRIDSAVLYSVNCPKLEYSYELYQKLPTKPEYENRLRQLYKQDYRALIALIKYHRKEEKQEIVRLLSQMDNKDLWSYRDTIRTALDAVAAWPSASYRQQVRQVCQNILNREDPYGCSLNAFGALMAYNEKWSYDMIDKTLSKAKQKGNNNFDLCWSFHEAYEENPLPLFKLLTKKYPLK